MIDTVTNFLLPGALLGIIAALSPGPLMALIVSETLKNGFAGGMRIAVAPVLTDIPFILGAFFIAKSIESSTALLAAVSFIGAMFMAYLAYQNFSAKKSDFSFSPTTSAGSLKKGMAVNLLNPHMYIYWFSVATPVFAVGTIVQNSLYAGALLFFSVLIMVLMAYGISRIRLHIFDYAHWILRILGLFLLLFSWKLLMDGARRATTMSEALSAESNGGPEQIRTVDTSSFNRVLYQLSYRATVCLAARMYQF